MTPAIEARGLGRAYGERVVLKDLTFSVPEGATLAVLGANGAGKTTLLRMLATLLRPQAGTIEVLGAELPRAATRCAAGSACSHTSLCCTAI